MTDAEAALAALSEKAADFEFPVLDNANWDFVAGRMRGFRQGPAWALTFEVLIFQIPARDFCVTAYSYGSLPGAGEGHSGSLSIVEELPEHPLWDENGEWIASGSGRRVRVLGDPVLCALSEDFDSRLPGEQLVRLAHGDDRDEGAFLRSLTRELGLKRTMPELGILRLVPPLQGAAEVLRLTSWDHPDIAGEQVPADSHAISAAVRFLCGESPSFTYDHSRDNVDWRNWILEY